MQDSILTSIVLPASLAVIMLGMGLSLVPADFARVFKLPKAALLGLVNQLILLPLVGFLLAVAFALDPMMAVGLMIIAACPGGPTSNLITHVARGDIALSISLTAMSSLITVFTIPLILNFALEYFAQEGSKVIQLPVGRTIVQIMVITIIPVSMGMIIRRLSPRFAQSMDKPMRVASSVIFVAVLAGIILANKKQLVPYMEAVGVVTLCLNLITMVLGYYSARLFGLNMAQRISITIESGIQNGTLAIVIATTILMNAELSIPAAVYSLLMFLTAGFLMVRFGRREEKTEPV